MKKDPASRAFVRSFRRGECIELDAGHVSCDGALGFEPKVVLVSALQSHPENLFKERFPIRMDRGLFS